MTQHAFLDQGISILNVRLATPAVAKPPAGPPPPFITISRECCAGATTLGSELTALLDEEMGEEGHRWVFFDKDLITYALTQHQLPQRLAQYLPEDRISEIKGLIGELVGLHPSLWQLEHKITEAIMQLAHIGRVVIVGRGGNVITRSMPGGLHVRLVAPFKVRAHRMMEMRHCSEAEAMARIEEIDTARQRFVHTRFGEEIDDPHAYDMVINTGRLAPPAVAQLVLATLRIHHGVLVPHGAASGA